MSAMPAATEPEYRILLMVAKGLYVVGILGWSDRHGTRLCMPMNAPCDQRSSAS